MISAATCSIEHMGSPILGFSGGRVDCFGRSVLNMFFIIVHLKCWSYCYFRLCSLFQGGQDGQRSRRKTISQQQASEMIFIVFGVIFLGFFSAWLLLSMSPEQLYNSTYRCV